MGGALTDAVWLFAALLVLVFLAAAVLASRRYLLERSGGTVECALRRPASAGPAGALTPGWRLGVLSYQRDELRWYGALGVLLRPEYVFYRRGLTVVTRRPATEAEAVSLGADRVVVEVAAKPPADSSGSPAGEHVELAMTEQALTGFLSWIEASPPGSHLADFSLTGPPPRFGPVITRVPVADVLGSQSQERTEEGKVFGAGKLPGPGHPWLSWVEESLVQAVASWRRQRWLGSERAGRQSAADRVRTG